jgi:hypothetical protein
VKAFGDAELTVCVLLVLAILTVGAVKGLTIGQVLRILWLALVDAAHGRWPTGRKQ